MNAIAVVTDTDASLPPELAARYRIGLVPINVHFGDEKFETGIDIDDETLFARVDREGVMPTTSAPTPGQFARAYQAAFDAGAQTVICFCVSSAISATYSAALSARELVEGGEVVVVDTQSVSMGQGFMALAAAEAAEAGAGVEEILARAQAVRDHASLYASLATLRYLALSGRVGQVAAGMGDLLHIKPILTMREGKLDLLEKVRTRKRAWARVVELMAQSVDGRPIERMAVVHVAAEAEARAFADLLRESVACPEEIVYAPFTAGLSVHTGPGFVGVIAVAAA